MSYYHLEKLLSFFEKNQKALSFQELIQLNNIQSSQKHTFGSWMSKLCLQGVLYHCPKAKTYAPTKETHTFEGVIKINEKNFGFVENYEKKEVVFVIGKHFNGALDGDKVLVRKYEVFFSSQKYFGIIEKVIQRKRRTIIGIIAINPFLNKVVFQPLDTKLKGNFWFPELKSLALDLVLECEILDFRRGILDLKLLKIFGKISEIGIDVKALVAHHGLSWKFPTQVEEQANSFSEKIDEAEITKRVDLRDKLIFTIDGEKTKDFDDAISVELVEEDIFKLGIHIADVATFVQENSLIDQEAKKRATSVYFLDFVIPMIPSRISDCLCSLIPNQDRLTITLELLINKEGKLLKTEVFPSIIRSRYRLTYTQVNAFFENKRSATEDLKKALNLAKTVSEILIKQKQEEGFFDLEINVGDFSLDDKQEIRSIKIKKRGLSELMIESFMLKANEVLANLFVEHSIKGIFRVHEPPEKEKFEFFQNFLTFLGFEKELEFPLTSKQFCQCVDTIKQKNLLTEFAKNALLRSLEKAFYSAKNTGHFGLATNAYLHFSSPLRRYPDLFCHRMLHEIIFKKQSLEEKQKVQALLEAQAQEIAEHSTNQELLASKIERDINDWKQLKFFAKQKGKKFLAEIVSIESNGLFCILESKTSGFLPFNLIDENAEFEISTFEAKSSQYFFKAGQKIWVEIGEFNPKTFGSKIIFKPTNLVTKKDVK